MDGDILILFKYMPEAAIIEKRYGACVEFTAVIS